jgi:hypothetical protein
MSAMGQKQTWQRILLMSALPPKADINWPVSASTQQLRQLGDIRRDPPRLIHRRSRKASIEIYSHGQCECPR